MRNPWIRVVTKSAPVESIPGEYVAKTSTGRYIYCYGNNATEAFNNSVTGLRGREYILSIGRNGK